MSQTKPANGSTPAEKTNPMADQSWSRTFRETVESVVIAFILAFLFRTFEAEAFVIPTGSMAPTLQGRHKDIDCPQCGYHYRVSASNEMDRVTGDKIPSCNVDSTTCPMCRFELNTNPLDGNNKKEYPSYNGDRIIVNKFAYELSDPQRWDVVVFKYPEDSKTNYIKRLVGLPNQRLLIANGDIYTAPLDTENFEITRKRPEKLLAMMQPVYDNDYQVPLLLKAGVAPRWQPWTALPGNTPWHAAEDETSFETTGEYAGASWLRYQHLLPNYEIWDAVLHGQHVQSPTPSLIKDFYAYNDGTLSCSSRQDIDKQHWVGDIALDCQIEVKNDRGSIALELVKGGVRFQCVIDAKTGDAKLSISGQPGYTPTATTAIHGPGTYNVRFSNVDEQLLLWINHSLVQFSSPTTYLNLPNERPIELQPMPGANQVTDLSPVGIAGQDGLAMKVSHLEIWRDIFYISDPHNPSKTYDLKADQFLMLGDNSPESSDSRFWRGEQFVKRDLLIGKALFIYWPHSWWPSWAITLPFGDLDLKIPFWPNFKQMKFVH